VGVRILCAKCGHLVEGIDIIRDDIASKFRIDAHCHGETDSMEMTDEWIASDQQFFNLIQMGLCVGVAFDDKRNP
jgi:hypothetical protein